MSTESPEVGEISTDGQFRWDGQAWSPLARGHREPTSWTLPLRWITAVYLGVSALVQLVTNILFVTQAALERSIRSSNPQLSDDQVQSSAALGYTLGWVLVAVIVVVTLVLAVGSLRGWRWVFWADLVVLVIGSVQIFTNAFALTSPATQTLPMPAVVLDLVLSVLALALLVWFILAAARFGPWAMRRPGVA